jgi:hypothetical protein
MQGGSGKPGASPLECVRRLTEQEGSSIGSCSVDGRFADEWSSTRKLAADSTCHWSDGSHIHGTGPPRNILTRTTPMVLYVCYMYHYIALQSHEIGSWTDWEVALNEE